MHAKSFKIHWNPLLYPWDIISLTCCFQNYVKSSIFKLLIWRPWGTSYNITMAKSFVCGAQIYFVYSRGSQAFI